MVGSDEKWLNRVITSVRSSSDLRHPALLLAVSAPLWWLPGGFSRFVLAKLLVTALAVVVAAAARPVGALPRPVVVIGLAWAGVFALAAVTGDTPYASLVGRWPRYEGLPTLGLYAGAAWVGARVVGRGAAAMRRLDGAVSVVAILLTAFSVLDVLGVTPLGPSDEERSGSVLGNATDQGAVAMMAALLLAGPALRPGPSGESGSRRLALVGLAAALATVGLSGSRTALALTLVGLVVSVALPAVRARRTAGAGAGSRRLVARGVLAVVLLGVVAVAVPTTRDRLLGLGTAEGRLHQWRLTLDLVLDHPVLGIGGSRYVDAFLAYEDARFVDFTGPQRIADSPHSVLLQVLVAGGLVLLAATVLAAGFVTWQARLSLREHPEAWPAALAVTAYLALACVNFTTAGPTCFAALLLGVVIAVPPPGSEARGPATAASGAVALVLAPVLAVVLVAALVGEVRLARGVDAADRGETARAGEAFDEAARWRPWDVDARVIGARALAGTAALGDVDAARGNEALAREALGRVPDSYETLVALGVSLSTQGRFAEAAEALDRAVALAPERPDGFVQRAIARVGLGEVEAALLDLRRAREIEPRSPVVRRLLRQVAALDGG